jgi:hypothetical protein
VASGRPVATASFMRLPQSLAAFSLALLFIAGGCSASPITAAAPDEFDPRAVLDDAAGYQGPAFSHVSADVYASALGSDTAIDVYASTTEVAQYELISPEVSGSGSVVPEGGLIVRAVVDAGTGKPQRLTIMGKGPAGYNPDLGDWFFAVTSPDGTPVDEQVGRLDACYACHIPRAGDDYLFGVPAAERGGTGDGGDTQEPTDAGPGDDGGDGGDGDPGPVCGDYLCEPPESAATCAIDCAEGGGGDDGGGDGGADDGGADDGGGDGGADDGGADDGGGDHGGGGDDGGDGGDGGDHGGGDQGGGGGDDGGDGGGHHGGDDGGGGD